jgi:exonuclease SbcC
LYSYQKKQTIDFEELTNAGLFGIFGAVGSGKSSV